MYLSSNKKAKNICQTLSTTMSECNKNSINKAKKRRHYFTQLLFLRCTWIHVRFCIKKILFPVKYCEKPWKIVLLPPLFRKVKYRNNYFWRAWKTPQDEWLLSFSSRRSFTIIFLVSDYVEEGKYFLRKRRVSIYLAIASLRKAANGYKIRQ